MVINSGFSGHEFVNNIISGYLNYTTTEMNTCDKNCQYNLLDLGL